MSKFLTAMVYGDKTFIKSGKTVQQVVRFEDTADLQDFLTFCKPGEKFTACIGREGVIKAFATTASSQSSENKNRPVLVKFFSKYGCDVQFWLHPNWLTIVDNPDVPVDESDSTED